MMPFDTVHEEGKVPKHDMNEFIRDVTFGLLNYLTRNEMDVEACKFVGNNDIIVFRGTNTTILAFSRSKVTIRPLFSEYSLSDIIQNENEMTATEPTYFIHDDLKKNEFFKKFTSPVTIAFPTQYLTYITDEKKKALEKITSLLAKPTEEDIEKKRRIVRVNPMFTGREFLLEKDLCFVLMAFESPYTEIYDKVIKPTVESEGFRCIKSDDIFSTTSVIEDIWSNINKASLIIAEISNNNPNVMYELGICHTVGKEVMMITQHPENIPFNFRHLRAYPYRNDIAGSVEIKKNISSMIQHIKSTRK